MCEAVFKFNEPEPLKAIFTLNLTPSKLSELENDLKLSDFENDVGFVTEEEVDEKIQDITGSMRMSYRIIKED